PLTLLAGAGHWFIGSLNTTLLLPLLVGSFPGIILGTYAARWAPESVLRIALAVVLCIAGYKLVM
ncbi:MAG: TSUP family transporter, partial [Bryobacteraceae bacterium]